MYPSEWDPINKILVMPYNNLQRKTYLLHVECLMKQDVAFFRNVVEELEKQGNFTIDDIVIKYKSRKKENMLTSFVFVLVNELNSSGHERTAKAYTTTLKKVISFNNEKDLRFEHLNTDFLKSFENDLMSCGKSPNTISFYMRNLRAIYNKAIERKYFVSRENPFKTVYTGVRTTKKRALYKEDLNSLYSVDLNEIVKVSGYDKLIEAKHYFFFCFHARGMSFVDMVYLRKENIKEGVISYYRKKTGKLIEIKVTPEMYFIIDYFALQVINSPYVFPFLNDNHKSERLQYESALRVQNKRLKKLAKLAGIKETLSTHVARHSWATIAKLVNLPLWVISEGLGHSDEKTTYKYLASFERSVLDNANEQIQTVIHDKLNGLKKK